MLKVSLHDELFRGPGQKLGVGKVSWRAAGWSIRAFNVARVIPDNWRIPC